MRGGWGGGKKWGGGYKGKGGWGGGYKGGYKKWGK